MRRENSHSLAIGKLTNHHWRSAIDWSYTSEIPYHEEKFTESHRENVTDSAVLEASVTLVRLQLSRRIRSIYFPAEIHYGHYFSLFRFYFFINNKIYFLAKWHKKPLNYNFSSVWGHVSKFLFLTKRTRFRCQSI